MKVNSSVQNQGRDNVSDALDTEQKEEIAGTNFDDETKPEEAVPLSKIEAISELDLAAVVDATSSSRKSNASKLNLSF